MKKRDFITLAILAVIFIIIFVIMLINKDTDNEDIINNTEFNKLSLLTEEKTFLSVEKNINKIYEYANTESEALSFLIKDDINTETYKNKIFEATKIYVISKLNLYKYYVKGNLYEEHVDEMPKFIKEEYFIINYDMNTTSYNIEIIDETRFENASEEKHIFESINNNNYNRFEYSSLNPKTRALMYFNDFKNKMYLTPEDAYNLLSGDTKNNYFNTYKEFEDFIINQNNITLTEYSVNDNRIGIIDNYNNEYIFEITNILSYSVTINIAED